MIGSKVGDCRALQTTITYWATRPFLHRLAQSGAESSLANLPRGLLAVERAGQSYLVMPLHSPTVVEIPASAISQESTHRLVGLDSFGCRFIQPCNGSMSVLVQGIWYRRLDARGPLFLESKVSCAYFCSPSVNTELSSRVASFAIVAHSLQSKTPFYGTRRCRRS